MIKRKLLTSLDERLYDISKKAKVELFLTGSRGRNYVASKYNRQNLLERGLSYDSDYVALGRNSLNFLKEVEKEFETEFQVHDRPGVFSTRVKNEGEMEKIDITLFPGDLSMKKDSITRIATEDTISVNLKSGEIRSFFEGLNHFLNGNKIRIISEEAFNLDQPLRRGYILIGKSSSIPRKRTLDNESADLLKKAVQKSNLKDHREEAGRKLNTLIKITTKGYYGGSRSGRFFYNTGIMPRYWAGLRHLGEERLEHTFCMMDAINSNNEIKDFIVGLTTIFYNVYHAEGKKALKRALGVFSGSKYLYNRILALCENLEGFCSLSPSRDGDIISFAKKIYLPEVPAVNPFPYVDIISQEQIARAYWKAEYCTEEDYLGKEILNRAQEIQFTDGRKMLFPADFEKANGSMYLNSKPVPAKG